MPIPAIAIPIISLVSTVFKGWMGTRKVKAEGKVKIAQAKVEAKIRKIDAQSEMDLSSTNQMQYSLKDEFLTILMSVPIIMCFIPALADYALRGFAILEGTPLWYRACFTGIVAASFGLRTWLGHLKGKM